MTSEGFTFDLLAITGPTACGKTQLAVALALRNGGEIISADSRQVYRGMDIGTGKDLREYVVDGQDVPYHLIDILEPGAKYNVFEFQRDFFEVYHDVRRRGKMAVVCGGSGMYLDSVVSKYNMMEVPPDIELRNSLENRSMEELTKILSSYKTLHNTTDIDTPKRAIRAIEIEEYQRRQTANRPLYPSLKSLIIGVMVDRELRRERISKRLRDRLDEGLIEEVERLLAQGVTEDQMIYYGLEYKYVTLYIMRKLSFDMMFRNLEIAIHQFAKRQMTWFRGMERKGVVIHWIDGSLPLDRRISEVEELMREAGTVSN